MYQGDATGSSGRPTERLVGDLLDKVSLGCVQIGLCLPRRPYSSSSAHPNRRARSLLH